LNSMKYGRDTKLRWPQSNYTIRLHRQAWLPGDGTSMVPRLLRTCSCSYAELLLDCATALLYAVWNLSSSRWLQTRQSNLDREAHSYGLEGYKHHITY